MGDTDTSGVDWHVVKDAVIDAIDNCDGRVNAAHLEHAFIKAQIGIYHMPAAPAPTEARVADLEARLAEADAVIKLACDDDCWFGTDTNVGHQREALARHAARSKG